MELNTRVFVICVLTLYLSQSLSTPMALRYSPNTISPDCDVSLSSVDAMLKFNKVCAILLLSSKSFTKWVKVFSVAFVFLLPYYTVFPLVWCFSISLFRYSYCIDKASTKRYNDLKDI